MRQPTMFALLVTALFVSTSAGATEYVLESKLGATMSKFSGEVTNASFMRGFTAGVAARVTTAWGQFQPELTFATKGTSYGTYDLISASGSPTGDVEGLYALGYIELPVLYRSNLGKGMLRPSLLLGPTFSYKSSEKVHFTGSANSSEHLDNAGRWDVGATAGLGLDYGGQDRWLTFEMRWTQGLLDIQRADTGGKGVRNNDLRLTLGWARAFGGE